MEKERSPCFGRICCVETSGCVGGRIERVFSRVGGHGCFLNHSLPLHARFEVLSPFSSPLLVSRHCRSRGIIVAKTSNNVPNDRLFSSGDIDLPANRKPVKMNPLNREQVPTPADFVTASRNATRINLPPRSKQEAFCAKERSR